MAEIKQLNKQPSEAMLKSQYRGCFSTPDGKAVYKDLMDNFYHCRIAKEHLERQVGHRDVMLGIREMMNDG